MRFKGRRVLVTGGSGGLGRYICADLVRRGAVVGVLDRQAPDTPGVGYIAADLSSSEGIDAAAAQVAAEAWDVLINLAGVQYFGPMEDQSAAQVQTGYLINLIAPARLIQAVIPGMKARGFGRIVNIGSIFGSINFAHFATYSSAKAGLRGLSQALRRELTGTGMDEPGTVAARIVSAIRADRRDVYLGFPEALFVRINAIFPSLVDGALRAKDIKARALFAKLEGNSP